MKKQSLDDASEQTKIKYKTNNQIKRMWIKKTGAVNFGFVGEQNNEMR